MKWVLLDGRHINTNQIRLFRWVQGWLYIFYAGDATVERLADPDRKLYLQLCHALGVQPTEEVGENGQN